jgi:hypothetical protein
VIGLQTRVETYAKRVNDAKGKAAYKNVRHALASIRAYAKASMKMATGPKDYSAPGTPPNIHRGNLWRSIRYGVTDGKAGEGVVGPSFDIVGIRGYVLEFAGTRILSAARGPGGRFKKGQQKRAKAPSGAKWSRPFMSPALERAKARMASDWRAAIN